MRVAVAANHIPVLPTRRFRERDAEKDRVSVRIDETLYGSALQWSDGRRHKSIVRLGGHRGPIHDREALQANCKGCTNLHCKKPENY